MSTEGGVKEGFGTLCLLRLLGRDLCFENAGQLSPRESGLEDDGEVPLDGMLGDLLNLR